MMKVRCLGNGMNSQQEQPNVEWQEWDIYEEVEKEKGREKERKRERGEKGRAQSAA